MSAKTPRASRNHGDGQRNRKQRDLIINGERSLKQQQQDFALTGWIFSAPPAKSPRK